METMEWTKQSEDMLKTWNETQKKMWDEWTKAIQGFGKSPSAQVWEKTLETWNQTIQKVLDSQVEGARLWAEKFTTAKGMPQENVELAKQGQEMIIRWTETQKHLWENWFDLLKKLDVSNAVNWSTDGPKFLQQWQETIKKAFDAQAEWLRTTAQTNKKA
jgi:hypothetical protein